MIYKEIAPLAVYTGNCEHCKTTFEFTAKDDGFTPGSFGVQIACPVCTVPVVGFRKDGDEE